MTVEFTHRLRVARNVFDPGNPTLRALLAPPRPGGEAEVCVCADEGVLAAHENLPGRIAEWAAAEGVPPVALRGPLIAVPGGEASKNDAALLETVIGRLHAAGLCRRGYVLAVGGGAVLDVVGLAAALVHRGVQLVRVPSTTLAQADSGVGVKNGVNAYGEKNFLGTFAVPAGVVLDPSLLATLDPQVYLAGFAEVVKVGLVRDGELFEQVEAGVDAILDRRMEVVEPLIVRSAELHFRHIVEGGDPFETGPARPLDFGHWAAHWLEVESEFTIPHGQAVAIGLALDTVISSRVAGLSRPSVDRVLGALARLGLPVFDERLRDVERLVEALESFRRHLGGELTVALLTDIGSTDDVHALESSVIAESVARLEGMKGG